MLLNMHCLLVGTTTEAVLACLILKTVEVNTIIECFFIIFDMSRENCGRFITLYLIFYLLIEFFLLQASH